nr:hypothetical protein [Pandoravirus belohorizontensis]
MATRGLAMPLLPSDAVPRGDVDGRGAVDTGGGSSSSSGGGGGASEGGSSYYQMFMRAIHAGGLHGGIFRDEAPLTLLRCMERAAHECLAHVDDALVRKGFVGRVYEEALGRALDTFSAWTGAMLDEETQRIVDAHPQIDTVLFRSVCAAYVREVHADTLRTGQRASIRLPAFGDFVREFFRHLAADPYVRSAAYFDRARLAERKLVHVDAVRASLEQCMRNKVTFVAAPPPTPTAATTSTYASSPASSSASTSSSSSSSSTATSSASTAPTPSSSVSTSTPSASTPASVAAPPSAGSFAPRGHDADGAHTARSRVVPDDAPKTRPQGAPPARVDRPPPARTPLPAGQPRDGPILAPGDFGPIADGRPRPADDAAADRQQPHIAGAFASHGPRRPDRPWPTDGGRAAFAKGAYAAADPDSTIDVTSATGDEGDDESFQDPSDVVGRRDLDIRRAAPLPHLGRAAAPHMRDAPGTTRQQGAPWPPPPDGTWPPGGGGRALQAGPTGALAPLPPRRGHARPAIRLVDESAAPRYAAQSYGAPQASRRPYSFPRAGAYHAAVDHSDNNRHDPDGDRGDDDALDDDHGDDDDDDDDGGVEDGDCENDGVMADDDSRGVNYGGADQWSG